MTEPRCLTTREAADLDTLREAAQLMRERAQAAFVPWHPWSDKRLPERSTVSEWREDMKGYLGGPWGEHAASWHPVVALAVADWLCAEAGGEVEPLGRHANGQPALTDTFDAALTVARSYLDSKDSQ